MSWILAINFGAQWILIGALYFAVLVLYRHFGQQLLIERQQFQSGGPTVNDSVSVKLETVDGAWVAIGKDAGRYVLMFAAPGCGACEAIRPQLNEALKNGSLEGRDCVVVYHGDRERTALYVEGIAGAKAVADPGRELARLWNVPWTPFFVATGPGGVVRWKGASLFELKAAVKAVRTGDAGDDSADGTPLQESKVTVAAKAISK